MPEQVDQQKYLQAMANAGLINHLLATPDVTAEAETAILQAVNTVVHGPVIRAAPGQYAFSTPAENGPKICDALADVNGTLSGLIKKRLRKCHTERSAG